jgi:rRNA maturation endonuclease Nob1
MEEDFDALYKQRRDRERHEEALEEVNQKINSLDEESKEEVRQTFKELTEGKTLTNKNAIKFLEMATLYSGK